jgi:hypothetical protein
LHASLFAIFAGVEEALQSVSHFASQVLTQVLVVVAVG